MQGRQTTRLEVVLRHGGVGLARDVDVVRGDERVQVLEVLLQGAGRRGPAYQGREGRVDTWDSGGHPGQRWCEGSITRASTMGGAPGPPRMEGWCGVTPVSFVQQPCHRRVAPLLVCPPSPLVPPARPKTLKPVSLKPCPCWCARRGAGRTTAGWANGSRPCWFGCRARWCLRHALPVALGRQRVAPPSVLLAVRANAIALLPALNPTSWGPGAQGGTPGSGLTFPRA
jgi:hypothetical protein